MKRAALSLVAALLALTVQLEAVDLNSRGEVAMGAGGLPGSVEGVLIPDAMGARWMTDDVLVYPAFSRPSIMTLDRRTGVVTELMPRGANDLMAGGGVVATWQAGFGLWASTGLFLPDAGLMDVGPDGAIAYVPNRQVGLGVNVRERDGSEWRLSEGVVYDLQLLGGRRAIWTFAQQVFVRGIPQPRVLPGGVWRPRVVEVAGRLWVSYFSGQFGVVLHPFDALEGYTIWPPGVDAFAHDAVALGSVIRVGSGARAGELPEDYRRRDVNTLTEPARPFVTEPTPPTPPTPPKPVPPIPPQAPPIPEDLFQALVAAREHHPTPLGNRGAALINEVTLRFPGWGLERKDGGNRCPQPVTETLVACDILRGPGNWGYDVLSDQEGAGVVTRATGGPADPARFIAPVPTTTDPDPNPPPGPDLVKLLQALTERIAALEVANLELRAAIAKGAAEIKADLEEIKNRPIPPIPFPPYVGRFLGQTVILRPQ